MNLNEYQDSVRVWSVSELYLNCIWELILNDYQNGILVWSISELYLKVEI